ncbi:hypothetical protein BS78_K312400 [Paspalum vaginatum]|uniref:Uncharacterized protein n=1 Tax=Paspalum vaginatum TaxID=158149 RepID=A0A9W7XDW3_9POAL|nr:hypothetical protein BS78_K312400 [Paspalum vaginatum]KAJ1256756.1 hypothetical protein BS78_K312400 [Paspalum vaginatum]KAJ1256757.1 hypothetical protein BS78_K312400 [Paspalum vaginatum]KAJ1256758.1 hypothetical protein BS78_K312400 [Paspalum vaginatum]
MSAVLDALAPYVKNLIRDMAQEEVFMLLGVSGEIKKLEDNTETLKAFLVDAERKRLSDQSVRIWVRKLKDSMYDAVDIIELCQLEADERRETGGGASMEQNFLGCCQPLLICLRHPMFSLITCGGIEKIQDFFQQFLFCGRNPVFAHEIGSRIKELNQRLECIHKEARDFNINITLGSNPQKTNLTAAEPSRYKTKSQIDESAIVGEQIEKDTKELVQVLTTYDDNNHSIKVVSVIGTGGMGKTTLAQKIFNGTTMQEHFKTKIWLSITQHFDDAELLRTAINHAGGVYHGGEQDKSTLTNILTNILSYSGRFLLVMDDVWSQKAWNDVLSVPVTLASQKQPGSRVLVTTRSACLPQEMRAPLHQHRVQPLGEDDAWSLLKKQLRPDQVARVGHLKEVGIEIIKKCGGLPLAIKVMGGLLSTKSLSKNEWEAVLNHRAWSVAGLPEELDNRIYLSYEDLCPELKQCFLYCSLFPKGTTISQAIIVPMWISEGFVEPHGNVSSQGDDGLEETATRYYKELITRNLIEPTKGSSVTGYNCTMHDVVRSFAEFMAREDSLVFQDRQLAGGSSNDSPIYRMSVGPSKLVLEWAALQKHQSLRTLIINCKISFSPNDSLTGFSRLRVLSLKGTRYCDRLVGSLCELRHLRYLSLEETHISRLPHDIHRMKFLQHVLLRQCWNLESLPGTITKLVNLRTLVVHAPNRNVVIPRGFGQLTNLRTLLAFPVHVEMGGDGSWCSLEEIGPLSHLRKLSLYGLDRVPTSSLAEMATIISSKDHLDYLELHWSSSRCMGWREEMEKQRQVIDKLEPPSSIQHLRIEGYFGCQLPNWMMVQATSAFTSLTFLKLKNLPCCTRLPDGLCQLPCLESLDIEDAPAIKSVGPEFQSSFPQASFPNLTTLRLAGLSEWSVWGWEEQQGEDGTADAMAMPVLDTIRIQNCKLTYLPPGLASSNRHALRELNLYQLTNLIYLENFPSVVELDVFDCPQLKRISGLYLLQKIRVQRCRDLEVLEGVPSLHSMQIVDPMMETLPEYLTRVEPRYLKVACSKKLCESLLTGSSWSEYNKIRHIKSPAIDYID